MSAARFCIVPLDPDTWREIAPLVRTAKAMGGTLIIEVNESFFPDAHGRLVCFVLSKKARDRVAKILAEDAPGNISTNKTKP